MARASLFLLVLSTCAAIACGERDDDSPQPDGGLSEDASLHDGGLHDGGLRDAGPPVPRSIIFLHTNDEHSHVLGFGPEIDDYPMPAGPEETSIVGGVKRRAKLIQEEKTAALISGVPVVVVSAGDLMMGSIFQLGNARGLDYAVATLLQYDAVTLGNHEFDFGAGFLADALANGGISSLGAPGIVRFPVIVSNLRFSARSSADDDLAGLWSPEGAPGRPLRRTHIQTFGSVKVGFIGLMGVEAALLAPGKGRIRFSMATNDTACVDDTDCASRLCIPPASVPTSTTGRCAVNDREDDAATHFPALIADTAAAVAELRTKGVDLVVALSHAGVDARELAMLGAMGLGPDNAVRSEEILLVRGVDRALASSGLAGIDVVIGGHSHTALERPLEITNERSGIKTTIVQAGENGRYLGKLRLSQASKGAPWTVEATETRLIRIDATVSSMGLSSTTEFLIDFGLQGIISALEGESIARAGNGAIEPGEECDGTALPNAGDCAPLIANAISGSLACSSNRQLDLSRCVLTSTSCGDARRDPSEMCDGADVGGATCASLGFDSGTLTCYPNCTFDRTACVPHFPSLLETALAFGRDGFPIRDQSSQAGDLLFRPIGIATFDVPTSTLSAESNLMNLVTDAERYTVNQLEAESTDDPVQVVIAASGVIRDGIQHGRTNILTFSDLFRVLPLGVSPVDGTPGFPMVDFHLTAVELKDALEIGLMQGLTNTAFWLGVSGARVEYDPSRPPQDRITRIVLTENTMTSEPWLEAPLESIAVFDRSLGPGLAGFPTPERSIHVASNLYLASFAEQLGICPRAGVSTGYEPLEECRPCMDDDMCPRPGSRCDAKAHRCVGAAAAALRLRALTAIGHTGLMQEIKETLALIYYIEALPNGGSLPTAYAGPVPRRLCCVGPSCEASRMCR